MSSSSILSLYYAYDLTLVSRLIVHQGWFSDKVLRNSPPFSLEAVKRWYLYEKWVGHMQPCAESAHWSTALLTSDPPAKPQCMWVLCHCLHVGSHIYVSKTYIHVVLSSVSSLTLNPRGFKASCSKHHRRSNLSLATS